MKWNETKRNDMECMTKTMSWNESEWLREKMNDWTKWHGMEWNEMEWMNEKMKWNEMTWNEIKRSEMDEWMNGWNAMK